MPNPKRRHSHARKNKRRAHDHLHTLSLSDCPNCHEKKLPHQACPHCGANLNNEECRCEKNASDPRLAPLARLKQDWFKKQ